ncbi:delta(3,5)-delta(2,4)-dienoyl-CoA isomerase, peroxisomal, partial [Tanacetum coccineum]
MSSSSSSSSYTTLEIIQQDTNNPSVFTFDPEPTHQRQQTRCKHFCSGIDLSALNYLLASMDDVPSDRGRSGEKLLRQIYMMQEAVSAIEKCRKVVVAAVHGACI